MVAPVLELVVDEVDLQESFAPELSTVDQINFYLKDRRGAQEFGGSIVDPQRRWRTIQMARCIMGEIKAESLLAMNIKFDNFTADIPKAILIGKRMRKE